MKANKTQGKEQEWRERSIKLQGRLVSFLARCIEELDERIDKRQKRGTNCAATRGRPRSGQRWGQPKIEAIVCEPPARYRANLWPVLVMPYNDLAIKIRLFHSDVILWGGLIFGG